MKTRLLRRVLYVCGDEDEIGAAALGQFLQRCGNVDNSGIDGKCCTTQSRQFQAARDRVSGENRTTAQFQEHCEKQPNRSLTLDKHNVARLRIALLDCFEASIERLDEGRDFKRNAMGNLLDATLDNPIHDADILRKSAAGRFKTGSHAHLFINRALGVKFALAVEAFTAGDVMEDNDAVAGFDARDPGSDTGHYTRGLVSVNAWGSEQVVFDLLEIGMADAAGFDADKDFAGTDFGGADGIDRNEGVAAIDGGLHMGGDHRFKKLRRQGNLPVFLRLAQYAASNEVTPQISFADQRVRRPPGVRG